MSDTPDECFDDGCLDYGWLVVGAESLRFSSVDVSPLGCRFSNLLIAVETRLYSCWTREQAAADGIQPLSGGLERNLR